MDLPAIVNVLTGLMVVLCAAMVVYGGWLCWREAAWIDENDRQSGQQSAFRARYFEPDAGIGRFGRVRAAE